MGKGAAAASNSNQTAEKLLVVLEALADQSQPMKLSELAHLIDMNASTLYRFLTALQNRGYVTQHESSGKYALNLKLCCLAENVKKQFSISRLLHYAVVSVAELFQESAHLAEEENHMIVYLDNVTDNSQMLTIRQHIGRTAPLHCTGIGKLLLLEYSNSELDSLISDRGLIGYTRNTLTTKEALCRELAQVRRQGYALDNEECELGVRCVAVPVRDYTRKVVAGLSVSGPITRVTDEVIEEKLPRLKLIAAKASEDLGYIP